MGGERDDRFQCTCDACDPCTEDRCDAPTGECENIPVDFDGDPCTCDGLGTPDEVIADTQENIDWGCCTEED
jgi:hypothetical protein